jgi:hypothetical protein
MPLRRPAHVCEMSEGRRCGAILQALSDKLGTCLSTELRRVDLEVIDAWFMDSLLPSAHRQWNRAVTSTVRTHVFRRRSMISSMEHRMPTKSTGRPVRRRALSYRIPEARNTSRDGQRPRQHSVRGGCERRWRHTSRHTTTQQAARDPDVLPWTEPNPRLVASRSHAHEPVNPRFI